MSEKKKKLLSVNIGQTDISLNKGSKYAANYVFTVLHSNETVGPPDDLKWITDGNKNFPVMIVTRPIHNTSPRSARSSLMGLERRFAQRVLLRDACALQNQRAARV